MLTFGDVLYETQDQVATITLNRPERFNAMSLTMPDDLETAVNHADSDPSIHVILLTGAGRGFCGGYDRKQFADPPPGIQSMPWDHSPEGVWFKQRAEEVGFKQAIAERDSGEPIPGSKAQ